MDTEDLFVRSLHDIQQLETFLRELLLHVARQPKRPAHGADSSPLEKPAINEDIHRLKPEELSAA